MTQRQDVGPGGQAALQELADAVEAPAEVTADE